VKGIDVGTIYRTNLAIYDKIVNEADVPLALRYFNRKALFKQIAAALGISSDGYLEIAKVLMQEDDVLRSQLRGLIGL